MPSARILANITVTHSGAARQSRQGAAAMRMVLVEGVQLISIFRETQE